MLIGCSDETLQLAQEMVIHEEDAAETQTENQAIPKSPVSSDTTDVTSIEPVVEESAELPPVSTKQLPVAGVQANPAAELEFEEDVRNPKMLVEYDIDIVQFAHENDGVYSCTADPRKAHSPSIVAVVPNRDLGDGDVLDVLVAIKHSSRLPLADASDRIAVGLAPHMELVEAIGSSILPYAIESPEAPQWAWQGEVHHIPLNTEYRAHLRLRYLQVEQEDIGGLIYPDITVAYQHRIPVYSIGGRHGIHLNPPWKGRESAEYLARREWCKPEYWNTIADDGTDEHPIYHDGYLE